MGRARAGALAAALLAAAALALSGCGGSSKPSYCSSVDNLKSSIKAIPSTNIVASGVNGLKSAIEKVQAASTTAVNDAKSDFPSETSALKSSVDTLSATVKSLSSSPSASTLAQVPSQVSAVVTAVDNFSSATKSKCS
jgi:hypothetical protein